MENNFIDPVTKDEFFIPSFRGVVRGDKMVHTDKYGKTLINEKTGNELEPIVKEVHDFSGVACLKSNNKETRQAMLKKRSKDHFQKEVSEKKYQMNKDLIKKFEG